MPTSNSEGRKRHEIADADIALGLISEARDVLDYLKARGWRIVKLEHRAYVGPYGLPWKGSGGPAERVIAESHGDKALYSIAEEL
jgi:hypothetical protein